MTEFQSFDSLEEMFAEMRAAEEAANARALPQQKRIAEDNQRHYWLRPLDESTCIFGECWSADDFQAQVDNADDEESREEYRYERDTYADSRSRGYVFGKAYSVLEPDGEYGSTHVSTMMEITKDEFEIIRDHGWEMASIPSDVWNRIKIRMNDIAMGIPR